MYKRAGSLPTIYPRVQCATSNLRDACLKLTQTYGGRWCAAMHGVWKTAGRWMNNRMAGAGLRIVGSPAPFKLGQRAAQRQDVTEIMPDGSRSEIFAIDCGHLRLDLLDRPIGRMVGFKRPGGPLQGCAAYLRLEHCRGVARHWLRRSRAGAHDKTSGNYTTGYRTLYRLHDDSPES